MAPPLASAERSAGDIVPGFSSARADLKVGATSLPRADLKVGAALLPRAHLKVGATLLATLLVICLLSPSGVCAEEAVEHPFIEPKDIKPETCLTCHPEKKEGRFVHTAIGMGCENCHHIVSGKNKTMITLLATGGDLCAKCHETKKDPVLHGPYKNGQCLICHDPHSSQFKAQTRSAGNSLCLECHAPKRVTAETVSLFNLQKISRVDFEAIPKIELDPTLRFGHPCATHPVAEVADPLQGGERMSCLSCHTPHASTLPNLLVLAKGGGDLCDACHRAIEKPKQAELDSPQQAQPTPNLATESGLSVVHGLPQFSGR